MALLPQKSNNLLSLNDQLLLSSGFTVVRVPLLTWFQLGELFLLPAHTVLILNFRHGVHGVSPPHSLPFPSLSFTS